jgi:hypothetical protein
VTSAISVLATGIISGHQCSAREAGWEGSLLTKLPETNYVINLRQHGAGTIEINTMKSGISFSRKEVRERMEAVVVGATFVGSIATAFFVQRAVLGAMLRAFGRDKKARW